MATVATGALALPEMHKITEPIILGDDKRSVRAMKGIWRRGDC